MSARILILEDDIASLALVQYLLEAAGFRTVAAGDGAQGARIALSDPVDLILCDLQVPYLNGYEVLGRLRSDPAWPPVPVIAVTASSMIGDRERVLAAGFDGYISKPIDPQTFVGELGRYLDAGSRSIRA
jgi:CheY-like chemotaxis protein